MQFTKQSSKPFNGERFIFPDSKPYGPIPIELRHRQPQVDSCQTVVRARKQRWPRPSMRWKVCPFICKSIQNSIQFFCKRPFRSSLFTSASLSCSHSHGSAHMSGVKWHCRYVMPSVTSASLIECSLPQDSTPFAYLFNSPILLT